MAVISEVKCGRCDRRYSGFRSRCPYCGARRNKRGKRADEAENAKAKMIIGVVLLLVLVGAAMVLILTSLPSKSPDAAETPSATSTDEAPAFTDNENVNEVGGSPSPDADASASPGTSPDASPDASPDTSSDTSPDSSPSTTPGTNVVVQSVTVTYRGEPCPDATLKRIGETLQLRFKTTPDSQGKQAVWESSDPKIFTVADGKVTAVGKGSATLKCTVDGVTGECIIRVRGTT